MCASDQPKLRLATGLLAVAMAVCAPLAFAQADKDAEQTKRLRLQMRQIQQQQQQAQEAQAQAEQARQKAEQSLKAQEGELQKQRATAGSAQRKAATLEKDLDKLKADNERLKAELAALAEKQQAQQAASRTAQEKAVATETRLTQEGQQLGQQLQRCKADNQSLVSLGQELLARYEAKGIGEVLSANEPFVQTGRVKLENFKAAYGQRIEAAKVKPGEPTVR